MGMCCSSILIYPSLSQKKNDPHEIKRSNLMKLKLPTYMVLLPTDSEQQRDVPHAQAVYFSTRYNKPKRKTNEAETT
jgi:hypothetical protein